MAGELVNKTISKYNAGFPGYLDFQKLRSAAIEYLGKLSGKIWTDHNVHDPGITIIETLIYAIMDLGYRTHLPVADLFAPDPSARGRDNNFFTAAQILANNPLTITDLRKMLVDMAGVKNAWLEVDDQVPADVCGPTYRDQGGDDYERTEHCGCQALNGLYHVYVQLEKEVHENKHRYQKVLRKIKQQLMEHRNLCEDYLDIKVLCSLEIGVCADVELEPDVDGEAVFLEILKALQEFFSPAPRFYTFQQLIEKGRTVDEIFAGRPFNINESHGFVDTEEFEQLRLRRVLHLSDLYQTLFNIKGVSKVLNLGWIKCCDEDKRSEKKADRSWQLRLPEDHIPEFSLQCSGFRFTKNGLPLEMDQNRVSGTFGLNLSGWYKTLYKMPSPYLGPVYPKGNFRPELANYFSIQSEFPKVYGISEGGLPANVPPERLAKARQLQGFLLFFDQLLANYLSQLKNIRSLFALQSPGQGHTYFTNRLTDVPYFRELIRFRTEEGLIGNEGSILAYPTERKKLEHFIESGRIRFSGPKRKCKEGYRDDFPPFEFCYAAERDQAIKQLQEDLMYDDIQPVIVANENDCYFFYFLTSSGALALISKQYYGSEQEARNAAASVRYAASFDENYRGYLTEKNPGEERFSFDVELNLNTYGNYLQLIAEDASLYGKRRQEFLDHLLARFAERFTDFALLSAPFLSGEKLNQASIRAKENFLVAYDDISSNRGKAYDYTAGWKKKNLSGFEKRFKAITGIDSWERRFHCHFMVERADEQYRLSIQLFDEVFEVFGKIFGKHEALASLVSVHRRLREAPRLEVLPAWDLARRWQVVILDGEGNEYRSKAVFEHREGAGILANELARSLRFALQKKIFPGQFVYKVFLENLAGENVAESREHFPDPEQASVFLSRLGKQLSPQIRNTRVFTNLAGRPLPSKLFPFRESNPEGIFVNEDAYVFKPFDVFQLAERKKKFTLLNREATIQFDGLVVYEDTKQAREGFRRLLGLLHEPGSYVSEKDLDEGSYRIYVQEKGEKLALYFEQFHTGEAAEEKIQQLAGQLARHAFRLVVSQPIPHTWEFDFGLSAPGRQGTVFKSRAQYKTAALAEKASESFYSHIGQMELKKEGADWILHKRGTKMQVFATEADSRPEAELQQTWKAFQTTVNTINRSEEDWRSVLPSYRINVEEQFIYKLVDRNHIHARHVSRQAFFQKADAENKKKELVAQAAAGYVYPDIALAGDVINERWDLPSKTKWYHYQVKCTNRFYSRGQLKGQPLVLFESTRGFTDREEATRAFSAQHARILQLARREENYGTGKIISLQESLVHLNDPCLQSDSLVFVPRETANEFNGYEVQRELTLIVRHYPLRFFGKSKVGFSLSRLDRLGGSVMLVEDWRSRRQYRSAKEAMQAFRFFLLLLQYPGNFFVEWDETRCRYHIHLREVLAISARGFETAEQAWGEEGVERFICVSQTAGGFHHYWNRLNCSYSFYLACGNTGLVHPCSYETPKRRDTVLETLWSGSRFHFFELVTEVTSESIILNDISKKLLAWIHMDPEVGSFSVCDWMLLFIETAQRDENYVRSAKGPQLVYRYKKANEPNYSEFVIAEALQAGIGLKEWKKALLATLCYFPVSRLKEGQANKYFVDIKLPGFENCSQYLEDPCKDETQECRISCYTAWKSECCFESCCEALGFYAYAYAMLRERENYKPVFDCHCGSYRVELHPRLTAEGRKKLLGEAAYLLRLMRPFCTERRHYLNAPQEVSDTRRWTGCFSEIIAINPQRYTTEKMSCEAAARARGLVNDEGLHLLEHVLLRPRCKNVDGVYVECACEDLPRPCTDNGIDCHFEWKPGGELDPCDEEKTICFTPGCDPYSFIATVALPAWPERFRRNRQSIEKILRREAPAHVLLRVLWLNPRDFCCFEKYYRSWSEWLAKNLCTSQFSPCDFMRFLFKKTFAGLKECQDCLPCVEENQSTSCFDETENDCEGIDQNKQLDEVFCWGKGLAEFNYNGCEPAPEVEEPILLLADVQPLAALPAPEDEPAVSMHQTDERPSPYAETVPEPGGRIANYTQNISVLPENTPVMEAALRFLEQPKSDPAAYRRLVEKILGRKAGKTKKTGGPVTEEKELLIRNITWKYLDSATVYKKPAERLKPLTDLFEWMKRMGVDMHGLFEIWSAQPHPQANISQKQKIRQLLTGE